MLSCPGEPPLEQQINTLAEMIEDAAEVVAPLLGSTALMSAGLVILVRGMIGSAGHDQTAGLMMEVFAVVSDACASRQ